MSELDLHIEKKIPFALFNATEQESRVSYLFFPAELRIIKNYYNREETITTTAVMKKPEYFEHELETIKKEYPSFQSLKPKP